MHPLGGRSRRARLRRLAPLLTAIFVAIAVTSPGGPPNADAGDALQVMVPSGAEHEATAL